VRCVRCVRLVLALALSRCRWSRPSGCWDAAERGGKRRAVSSGNQWEVQPGGGANNVKCYIEVVVRKDGVSAASCERRSRSPNNAVSNFPAGGDPPPPNRRWMSDVLTPKAPRAGGFPKVPAPT
jgi:hypothetical protein